MRNRGPGQRSNVESDTPGEKSEGEGSYVGLILDVKTQWSEVKGEGLTPRAQS